MVVVQNALKFVSPLRHVYQKCPMGFIRAHWNLEINYLGVAGRTLWGNFAQIKATPSASEVGAKLKPELKLMLNNDD